MILYHWTYKKYLKSILEKGLKVNNSGFLYLTPVKERTKSDIFADYNVLLEIETKNIRLTAFEGCEKWEVLCWGNILSENIKQLKVN